MPEDAAVLDAFYRRHDFVLAEVERYVNGAWASLSAYDEAQVAEFAAAIEAFLPAAQQTVASSVDAMVALMTESSPVGVPAGLVTNVRGIPTAEEFRRPFIQLWGGLRDGGDYLDLVAKAGDRAAKMAVTDTQIAMRSAMDHVASKNPQVVGYRRVLTPPSCMFCAAAATKTYGGRHLMPLHTSCDCKVAPIIGTRDPGKVANQQLLENLKAQGPDYWKKKGFVDSHGLPLDPTKVGELPVRVSHGDIGLILETT